MKLTQFFYNLFFPVIFVLFLPVYLSKMLRRGGYRDTFFQRFGFFSKEAKERIGEGRLWIHAVSVGEVFIALKLIRLFHKRNPQARFILSITTTTGLEIARREASSWLEPIANPLDFFFITNSFINRFKPAALIMVEGDLWVQRLWHCKKKRIPTAIVSTRLSTRSERRLKRFSRLVAPVFNQLDFMGFPSSNDQERWKRLGIATPHASVTGNIKFDQLLDLHVAAPQDRQKIFSSLGWGDQDPILLAGSTADLSEEEEVIKAWLLLRPKFPSLRLVLVPRHVERRHDIVALFKKYNIPVALRSHSSLAPAEVLLLDTTGELRSWYVIASVIFIGKSLGKGTARGGQNLVEPLVLGRPVLVGPYMGNFEPLASALHYVKGIMLVNNGEDIAAATRELLLHPQEATSMVERGCQLLQADQGATERTCQCLEALLL